MPHIIVEYSAHLALDVPNLLSDLHNDLAMRDTIAIEGIKTRAIPVEHCVIGATDTDNSFVHVALKLLPGRDDDLKKQLSQSLADSVSNHVKAPCSITAETIELHAESYVK